MNKLQNIQKSDATPMGYDTLLAVVLILGRFLMAFALGMLPIIIGLKNDWYVIPLVILNFVIQFGLATVQMLPYFKQVSKHYR